MNKFAAATLLILASTTILSAQSGIGSIGKGSKTQNECSSNQIGKGQGKFTGQISSAAAGSFQVASGKEMAAVSYNNSLIVCQNGQPSSTSELLPGAGVEVIGIMSHKGNEYEFAATKVFVLAAAPPSASGSNRSYAPVATNVSAGDFNQGAVTGSTARGNQQASTGSAITCNALQFEVTASASPTGKGVGRPSSTPITCKRNVDQESMTLLQDAITGRRLANITLSWQGALTVTLTNADVSGVSFTSDNTGQIVEIAFTGERWEINHSPTGSKVASDSWTQK